MFCQIDIFHLPSQKRRHTVQPAGKNGMVMALSLDYLAGSLTLVAGYENGVAIVAQLSAQSGWLVKYQAKCHSQPVLSLGISPSRDFFLTSSADAVIAKHPLPCPRPPRQTEQATPGEGRAVIADCQDTTGGRTAAKKSLLSVASAGEDRGISIFTTPQTANEAAEQALVATAAEPLKVVNTKHAGQQSLQLRSDGRVFATAGWDSKVRVYSAKTMKEVAVLKWHQVGCYAAAFAEVGRAVGDQDTDVAAGKDEDTSAVNADKTPPTEQGPGSLLIPKLVELTVRDKRIRQAKSAHWLAAGSKDGKVSLWDIF